MEERTNIVARITDEATVTLTTAEFFRLSDKAVRFDVMYADVKGNIDAGEHGYSRVDDDLILHALGLAKYQPPKKEED